jgi:predicted Zn-dependent protease
MECYMNDWCEILSYISQEDCDWIEQKTRSTLNIVKYVVKTNNNQFIDQYRTEESRFNSKTIFIDKSIITTKNKLRIDWVVYDIIWITPIKIANNILYYQIDVQVWSL